MDFLWFSYRLLYSGGYNCEVSWLRRYLIPMYGLKLAMQSFDNHFILKAEADMKEKIVNFNTALEPRTHTHTFGVQHSFLNSSFHWI